MQSPLLKVNLNFDLESFKFIEQTARLSSPDYDPVNRDEQHDLDTLQFVDNIDEVIEARSNLVNAEFWLSQSDEKETDYEKSIMAVLSGQHGLPVPWALLKGIHRKKVMFKRAMDKILDGGTVMKFRSNGRYFVQLITEE